MVEVASTPPSERYPGRPPEGRVVVIAPTRAACEIIELGLQLTCSFRENNPRPSLGLGGGRIDQQKGVVACRV